MNGIAIKYGGRAYAGGGLAAKAMRRRLREAEARTARKAAAAQEPEEAPPEGDWQRVTRLLSRPLPRISGDRLEHARAIAREESAHAILARCRHYRPFLASACLRTVGVYVDEAIKAARPTYREDMRIIACAGLALRQDRRTVDRAIQQFNLLEELMSPTDLQALKAHCDLAHSVDYAVKQAQEALDLARGYVAACGREIDLLANVLMRNRSVGWEDIEAVIKTARGAAAYAAARGEI